MVGARWRLAAYHHMVARLAGDFPRHTVALRMSLVPGATPFPGLRVNIDVSAFGSEEAVVSNRQGTNRFGV